MPPTYYQLLRVSRTATISEIRTAFNRAMFAMHPDTNGGDSSQTHRIPLIKEAHDVLSIPNSRTRYDASLLRSAPNFEPRFSAHEAVRAGNLRVSE